MRWYWFDRFVEFQSGRRAVGIKNVSLAEEQVFDYVKSYPSMPSSLILEGIAQVSGLLVGEMSGFHDRIVLAKVSRVRFYGIARPGDTLTYTAEIINVGNEGALISGTSHIDGEVQAELELYLAILNERNGPRDLFQPCDLLRMLNAFRLFEVGRDQDGMPLRIPEHLIESRQTANIADTT